MPPPTFTLKFQDEAIRQITAREYSVAQVLARIGVSAQSLYNWGNAVKPDKTDQQCFELLAASLTKLQALVVRADVEVIVRSAVHALGRVHGQLVISP
jgi:transposase-like protein